LAPGNGLRIQNNDIPLANEERENAMSVSEIASERKFALMPDRTAAK